MSKALKEDTEAAATLLVFAFAGLAREALAQHAAAPAPAKEHARQTGWASKNLRKENGWTVSDGNVAYEIVPLHVRNVTDGVMAQMLELQERVALVQAPDAANFIDYKTESEVADHYADGGVGLGIFNAYGKLIGQLMLSFAETADGPFAGDGVREATIGWLMVDPAYRGNMLCSSLMALATTIAAEKGASQVAAHVRVHNRKGIEKFSVAGFVAAGTGENAKDGSLHVKFYRQAEKKTALGPESFPRPVTLDGLKTMERTALFNSLAAEGMIAKWDHVSRWFTFHRPVLSPKLSALEL